MLYYLYNQKGEKMYKLIVVKWNKEKIKFEGDHALLGLIDMACYYDKHEDVKSVIVVDKTGFVYFYNSKVEGAKNIAVRFSKA
jgi:hypothetical protein